MKKKLLIFSAVLIIALSAVTSFFAVPYACVGTNEPWHEFSVNGSGTPTYLEAGYFRVFGEAEGLLGNNVTCLAYSQKNKLLYVGTRENWVYTFDGRDFKPLLVSTQPLSPNVISICYDEKINALAVGTNAGLVVANSPAHGKPSNSFVITTREGAISDTICSLASDGASIYAGCDCGVFRVAGNCVREKATRISAEAEMGRVNSLYVDGSKNLCVGTDTQILRTSDLKSFSNEKAVSMESLKMINRIGLLKIKTGAEKKEIIDLPPDIAFASLTGLNIIGGAGGVKNISAKNGLAEDWVTSFAYDNLNDKKNVKVSADERLAGGDALPAAEREELIKRLLKLKLDYTVITRNGSEINIKTQDPGRLMDEPAFKALNDKLQLFEFNVPRPAKPVPGLEAIKKGLWIGTKNSGVAVFNGSEFVCFNKENSPLVSNMITDILTTPNFVYVATEGGGLLRYGKYDEPNIVSSDYEKILDIAPNFIKNIGNEIFIGTSKGLYKYTVNGGTAEVLHGAPEVFNTNGACVDDNGNIVLASADHGVVIAGSVTTPEGGSRFGVLRSLGPPDGLKSSRCTAVYNVEKRGVLAGFGDMAARVSEKCAIITPDYKIQLFPPPAGTKLEEYDATSSSRSAISGFVSVGEGFFIGSLEGDSNALSFCAGSKWLYSKTSIGSAMCRISSMNKVSNNEICFAGDFGVVRFNGASWEKISNAGAATIGDSVCAMRDTVSEGLWILQRTSGKKSVSNKCTLAFSGGSTVITKLVDGAGIAFAQLDPFVFVGTTKGVYKIKKK
ncbi:MAG TPA: hypothetical protein PKK26_15080, partial [Candidatus Wallbacteria bacterium]|nr:hypothetical protein [Candidatus Wallbacteria bacterium]